MVPGTPGVGKKPGARTTTTTTTLHRLAVALVLGVGYAPQLEVYIVHVGVSGGEIFWPRMNRNNIPE